MFWRGRKRGQAGPGAVPQEPRTLAESAGTDPPTQFLTGDSDLDRRSVEVLLEAIARVSESRDLEPLLVDIVDRSIEITDAERGFLILLEPSGEPRIRVVRARGGEGSAEDARFSTSVVRRALAEGQPVLATVQTDSDALELGRSVFDLKLRAVMCVPLATPVNAGGPSEGAARGVLYVDSRAATREFSRRDLGLFAALSQHISIALENTRLHHHSLEKARLEQSLELASAIQSGLMPPVPRGVPGLDVHGWYRPAERTSGDFFDFVRTREGRLAVVVGDVAGHGIGPALITATAQATLRSLLRVLPDPAAALSMLNQDLAERLDPGMFLTLLLLVAGEDGRLDVLNAGHHGPLVCRGGEILALAEHGPALGFFPDSAYAVDRSLQLESGDVVLAFTDGLVETHGQSGREELYGEERVREILVEQASRGASAETITRVLAEAALSFSGGAHEDDITLVVVKKL
ncbi:MAG TPA: GAF domain-containing SpoIIE family protein phosphatase [Planctomycetota bacterium]|nr:GAF domain-containing SpoIIE family protein phosphatase [Planctomycetota bacterium]